MVTDYNDPSESNGIIIASKFQKSTLSFCLILLEKGGPTKPRNLSTTSNMMYTSQNEFLQKWYLTKSTMPDRLTSLFFASDHLFMLKTTCGLIGTRLRAAQVGMSGHQNPHKGQIEVLQNSASSNMSMMNALHKVDGPSGKHTLVFLTSLPRSPGRRRHGVKWF